MAFSKLTDRFNHIFSKMKNKGKLTELEVKQAMREIRIALLEADVNFKVIKKFIANVSEKATQAEILASLTPGQQIIDIVNEELIELMGKRNYKLDVASKPPTVILMCGLQGSGKTTMCGKLAHMLKKQHKKPLLVACDIYRPAAIKQLHVVGKSAGAAVFDRGQIEPSKIVKEALKEADKNGYDTVIIDTAGRLQIDEKLMAELEAIKKVSNPTEILLIVDAMTGQDAVNVAETFDKKMDITGVILTKLDGDTRGGAALSIRAVTGKPIKFCGVGEKISDIEPFYPDRMASRILGMGDVLTLIDQAKDAYKEEEIKKLSKKMKNMTFDLNDYLLQLDKVNKMGGLGSILDKIPGFSKFKGKMDVDESKLDKVKSIILSMTPEERENPDIIKSSRRKRIALGSGTKVQEVNALLKQFNEARKMMQRFKSGKRKGGFPFPPGF